MHITHEKKRQPHGEAELESSTGTPTLAAPVTSSLAMITPVPKCQSECGAELERDSKDTSGGTQFV